MFERCAENGHFDRPSLPPPLCLWRRTIHDITPLTSGVILNTIIKLQSFFRSSLFVNKWYSYLDWLRSDFKFVIIAHFSLRYVICWSKFRNTRRFSPKIMCWLRIRLVRLCCFFCCSINRRLSFVMPTLPFLPFEFGKSRPTKLQII